jgi:hypothetical protein
MRTRYRIAVADSLDAMSGYVVSNIVTKQLSPELPIVTSPGNNTTIYNAQPRFLITTGGVPDGRTQQVAVRIDNGQWRYSDTDASLFSISGMLPNGARTVFRPDPLAIGLHSVSTKCVNSSGSSAEVARSFTIAALPVEEAVQYVTLVTAAHMNALFNAAHNIKAYYGSTAVHLIAPIVAGITPIRDWPYHVMELRASIEGILYSTNAFDESTAFDVPVPPWIIFTGDYPRTDIINQITQLLQLL